MIQALKRYAFNFRVQLHEWFIECISKPLIRRADRRPPDFVIGGEANPYLRRWWLIPRNPLFNIYLHQVLRSDDDRALHCHPWLNVSIILSGCYVEVLPLAQTQASGFDFVSGYTTRRLRISGDVVFRRARHRHRLIVHEGRPCWSLFITGPRIRNWGFFCRTRWVPWQEFTSPAAKGEIGAGCGE